MSEHLYGCFALITIEDIALRNATRRLKLSDAVACTWFVREEAGNSAFLESGEIRCV